MIVAVILPNNVLMVFLWSAGYYKYVVGVRFNGFCWVLSLMESLGQLLELYSNLVSLVVRVYVDWEFEFHSAAQNHDFRQGVDHITSYKVNLQYSGLHVVSEIEVY